MSPKTERKKVGPAIPICLPSANHAVLSQCLGMDYDRFFPPPRFLALSISFLIVSSFPLSVAFPLRSNALENRWVRSQAADATPIAPLLLQFLISTGACISRYIPGYISLSFYRFCYLGNKLAIPRRNGVRRRKRPPRVRVRHRLAECS
jgi:hypothetical protein